MATKPRLVHRLLIIRAQRQHQIHCPRFLPWRTAETHLMNRKEACLHPPTLFGSCSQHKMHHRKIPGVQNHNVNPRKREEVVRAEAPDAAEEAEVQEQAEDVVAKVAVQKSMEPQSGNSQNGQVAKFLQADTTSQEPSPFNSNNTKNWLAEAILSDVVAA